MLLDNENKNLKVHEWIKEYTEEGKLDIITGYFTIGALAFLSKNTNEKIEKYRFILGDIVNFDNDKKEKSLDLLNENITIEAAFQLNKLSQEAVEFLKLNKVEAKTLEPNFCHAKAYLYDNKKDGRLNYFISGSSNLTEAGIGLKTTSNIELNIAETGNNNQYKELLDWFDDLWEKPEAHRKKTLIDEKGKEYKKDFKEYLIEEIERVFIQYSPKQIYFKILFELFGHQILEDKDNPEFNRQLGRLENSVIYETLYHFQQKGVLSLIKMLQHYNGAILADAVGLGKTWSALAVMKFFQLQGREVILLCPKKLENNWRRYLRKQDSKFEKDQFDYDIRFHTDLNLERMEKYSDRSDKLFINDRPKLLVIDESHNLRNNKSNRYKFLIEEIIKKNEDIKVLLLSATPINNSLNDIRSQFNLIAKDKNNGFYETLDIRNISATFKRANRTYNEWSNEDNPKIDVFLKKLNSDFFTLTDSLIVARTRKMIETNQSTFNFPLKTKPKNYFITPNQMGNFESFEDLFEHFPKNLSGYQPSAYIEQKKDIEKIHDEKQRDLFLVKMLYILLVKRLESSWFSFYSTIKKIQIHHQNALDKIKEYNESKNDITVEDVSLFDEFDTESDFIEEVEELSLGKKRKITLADIDSHGKLGLLKTDLKKDIEALDNIVSNLSRFDKDLVKETNRPNNYISNDLKLEKLIEIIQKKQNSGNNDNNKKVVIFTVYKDTADYLFEQLKNRGFTRLATVSGSSSKTNESDKEMKNFEPILERFAPFTKLFMEKEWDFKPSKDSLTDIEKFYEWIEWVKNIDIKTFEKISNPIDILIATDALSEGQNLQDADMVINYDIHWNPVRIIQRMGRIDRLGSPNEKIYGVNFWPSNNINSYLNLQGRIEKRMAAMKLAGSEVDHEFSETFKAIAEDQALEDKMNEKMLRQMETTFDDIEVRDQNLGFDNLSLDNFRQDLLDEINSKTEDYENMPKGVYSGFQIIAENNIIEEKESFKNGIISLLGFPSKPPKSRNHKYKKYDLVYIDKDGKQILDNQKEVFEFLKKHKDNIRFVPDKVDKGDEETIISLVNSLKSYLNNQVSEEKLFEDGTIKKVMGKEGLDILDKLKYGNKSAIERVKEDTTINEKFDPKNVDLIAWILVN